MPGNREIDRRKDRRTLDVNDRREVAYLHHQFPWFSENEIMNAIREKGPDRDKVSAYLEQQHARTSKKASE